MRGALKDIPWHVQGARPATEQVYWESVQLHTTTHRRFESGIIMLNCKAGATDPLRYTTVPVTWKRTWRSRVGHKKKVLELMGVA